MFGYVRGCKRVWVLYLDPVDALEESLLLLLLVPPPAPPTPPMVSDKDVMDSRWRLRVGYHPLEAGVRPPSSDVW